MPCKPTVWPNGGKFGGCLENDGTAELNFYTIKDTAVSLTITNEDIVFTTAAVTVTWPDPTTVSRPITQRSISGTRRRILAPT